jgi:hypothetical protein
VPVGETGEPHWTLGQLLVPEGEAEGILTGLSTTAGCGGHVIYLIDIIYQLPCHLSD